MDLSHLDLLAMLKRLCLAPELYYLRGGEYLGKPQTPLQWTQCNLRLALIEMRRSLTATGERSATPS